MRQLFLTVILKNLVKLMGINLEAKEVQFSPILNQDCANWTQELSSLAKQEYCYGLCLKQFLLKQGGTSRQIRLATQE
ncbi:hypothetical protein GcM1_04009 [Golovinomyces cichoracearum]|uniref:Uncharacterized protein n=1 Tax=Golovinomyces cichoracearum TaxID=62708 RepID=A0A420IST5_9PEZI|nr:hypothetical protein GcM1_04009 [Golovinomyces cichoracearum]